MKAKQDPVSKVFISSTCEDLEPFREAARDAALKARFMPVLSEYFPASGALPPLEKCLQEIGRCDVFIVIAAHRYGWVPPEQPGSGHKSITWLECERAIEEGLEMIAFIVDESAPWPVEHREEYPAVLEVQKAELDYERLATVNRNVKALQEFKEWLRSRGIRATFANQDELFGEIIAALNHWHLQNRVQAEVAPECTVEMASPAKALRMLLHQTQYIDIRGLQVGSGQARRIPIDELYIPLRATGEEGPSSPGGTVELREALVKRKLVIVGDPGSGKTTFLQRIAHTLCQTLLGADPDAARNKLGMDGEPPFPIYVRLSDLSAFIRHEEPDSESRPPMSHHSPEWLVRFLVRTSKEFAWGLPEQFFREKLQAGTAIVLMDGLDEAPTEADRKALTELLEGVASAYDGCSFVVTSRPKAYAGEVVMNTFDRVRVAPFADSAIDVFIKLWCDCLFPNAPELAEGHRRDLKEALKARLEIRRMARNPVMLTALAVVYWNQKRIPEQRAELYESIITWLSKSRQARPGRLSAERCVAMLQRIAMAMQNHAEGRQILVRRHWAAEVIQDEFSAPHTGEAGRSAAERFLSEEELDSGIIVGRGDDIRFWHLSFQEYLAARTLAGMSESRQQDLILEHVDKLLSSEWREMFLLFSGILHRQGAEKVTSLLSWIVREHARGNSLSYKAQVVGLLGEILRELATLEYRYRESEYLAILDEVMKVFRSNVTADIPVEIRLEVADALGQAGDPRLGPDAWVAIPSSAFIMGAQDTEPTEPAYDPYTLATEQPPHQIRLGSFDVARFPLTVQEFRRFVDASGYQNRTFWQQNGFGRWEEPEGWESQVRYPNHPVVGVSWMEAMAYCQWVGDGATLLTEAQWERVARGTEGRRYPWGNSPPTADHCNFAGSDFGGTTPVGFFEVGATPEGVYDCAGNVFEWCVDGYVGYSESTKGPAGERGGGSGELRVVRGGSFDSSDNFVRAGFRGRYPLDFRSKTVGFRVCRRRSSGEMGKREGSELEEDSHSQ